MLKFDINELILEKQVEELRKYYNEHSDSEIPSPFLENGLCMSMQDWLEAVSKKWNESLKRDFDGKK